MILCTRFQYYHDDDSDGDDDDLIGVCSIKISHREHGYLKHAAVTKSVGIHEIQGTIVPKPREDFLGTYMDPTHCL